MTQATKTLSVLFILSVILAITINLTTRNTSSELFGSEVLTFDRNLVNRISIQNDDIGNITLVRQDSLWNVVGNETGESFETEPDAVENALNSIEDLTIRSLLTRNADQHFRYEVDDTTGTFVELYEDDTLINGIVLGGVNFVSQSEYNTYLRVLGKNEVYAVSGFLTSQFNKDVNAWRNKTVWSIPENEIQQIVFEYPADSSFTLVPAIGESAWLTPTGDSVEADISNNLIGNLSRLRAQGFTPDEEGANLPGEPLYQIHVSLSSGLQRTLSITEGPEENQYIAQADGFPYLFTLGNSFRNTVLLSRDEILTTPEE